MKERFEVIENESIGVLVSPLQSRYVIAGGAVFHGAEIMNKEWSHFCLTYPS
jgi:hypothetical protein